MPLAEELYVQAEITPDKPVPFLYINNNGKIKEGRSP